MKLFILNCPYRKKQKNGSNNVRNKNSNATPLKEDMHTVQTGISHQVLLITLETCALQNPALQYRQNIFKKLQHWTVNSRKWASQVGSEIACTFILTYLYKTVHLPPSSGFRAASDIPYTKFPPSLSNTSHSPPHAAALHSSIWGGFRGFIGFPSAQSTCSLSFKVKWYWNSIPRTAPFGTDHPRLLINPSSDGLTGNIPVPAGTRNQKPPNSNHSPASPHQYAKGLGRSQ